MVQARKISVALTSAGQAYVWGLKSQSSAPKELKFSEEEHSDLGFIDIKIGNDEIFTLTSDGSLYSFSNL